MKKKISILFFTLGMSLFAETQTLQPRETVIKIELNDDVKLRIDCSYQNKTFFGKRVFSSDDDVNDFMNKLCEFNQSGSTYDITYKKFSEIAASFESGFKTFYKSSKSGIANIKYETLAELKNQVLYYHLRLVNERRYDPDDKIELDFPIISLENIPINITFEYVPSSKSFNFYEKYVIKNYKYDAVAKKITSFEIDKSFKDNSLRTFTSTYNIDNETECINGDIWVKKYGAKSGGNCKWIESSK